MSTRMRLLLGKEREIGIISIISIVVCSNGLLFYIQNITADDLKKSVFEQQKLLQIHSHYVAFLSTRSFKGGKKEITSMIIL
jgi:hypothetical protein